MVRVAQVKTGIWYDSCRNSSRTVIQLTKIRKYHSKHCIYIFRCGYIFFCGYKVINNNKHFSVKNYVLY